MIERLIFSIRNKIRRNQDASAELARLGREIFNRAADYEDGELVEFVKDLDSLRPRVRRRYFPGIEEFGSDYGDEPAGWHIRIIRLDDAHPEGRTTRQKSVHKGEEVPSLINQSIDWCWDRCQEAREHGYKYKYKNHDRWFYDGSNVTVAAFTLTSQTDQYSYEVEVAPYFDAPKVFVETATGEMAFNQGYERLPAFPFSLALPENRPAGFSTEAEARDYATAWMLVNEQRYGTDEPLMRGESIEWPDDWHLDTGPGKTSHAGLIEGN